MNKRLLFAGLLCGYLAGLVIISTRLSLWLDEVIQLAGVRDLSLRDLMPYLARNAGAAPLGYLVQRVFVKALGFSALSARLSSILFCALACVGVYTLAKNLSLKYPAGAVAIFALLPLQLRYATEARPYGQALALSIWTSAAFLRLIRKPSAAALAQYVLLGMAAVYSFPFCLFVAFAHLGWLAFQRNPEGGGVRAFIGTGLIAASFLPWYLYAHSAWLSAIQGAHVLPSIGVKTPLMILREITGAGYLGASVILVLAFVGYRWLGKASASRGFLLTYSIVPIVLVLLADQTGGYFFAIRQILFVLPPLALLAEAGLESITSRSRNVSLVAASTLAAVLLIGDGRLLAGPREDWSAAADTLVSSAQAGSCILFMPAESSRLYVFFRPELSRWQCGPQTWPSARIVAAFSPYAIAADHNAQADLLRNNYAVKQTLRSGQPRVELFERSLVH